MADNLLIKKGSYGRPKVPPELPEAVWERIDELLYDEDVDWKQFSVNGQLWIVLKCWEDEEYFSIIAALVQHETDAVRVDSIREPKKKYSYYDLFETGERNET